VVAARRLPLLLLGLVMYSQAPRAQGWHQQVAVQLLMLLPSAATAPAAA
jgi:hypothetical protein